MRRTKKFELPFPNLDIRRNYNGFCNEIEQLYTKWVFTNIFSHEHFKYVTQNFDKELNNKYCLSYKDKCKILDASLHNYHQLRKEVRKIKNEEYKRFNKRF